MASMMVSSKPKNKKGRDGNKNDQTKKIEKKNANCYRYYEKGHYAWECSKKKLKNDTSGGASNSSGAACAFAFSAMFEQKEIMEDDS